MSLTRDALHYHAYPTPGKISVVSTKPCETARDLALAYSPGVAEPCREIAKDPESVYRYTSKGNLVAVISNGTAVLGLGDIGPAAGKPVMEGKGVLFKSFADIDVFDLELDCKDPQKFVDAVAALAPTFGGINLEDIKAPECFWIEKELQRRVDIPVFHDDQHGTAIIAAAALLNALELVRKDISKTRVVVSGAGASAIACTKLLIRLGLKPENVLMCDSVGVLYKGREKGMNEFKQEFAVSTNLRTLADAMKDADVFFGLSQKDLVTPQMLLSMAAKPIVFALANPDPEISYTLAKNTRSDLIMATGRSDFPNQVNNVLGFPYIFRGALDVRAQKINEEMKLAAVYAIAGLAKEAVPDTVRKAYGSGDFTFGPEYLIPKPFDPRALSHVAPAVARAAMASSVARGSVDIEEYIARLKEKLNQGRQVLRVFYSLAKKAKAKRIAFPEGAHPKVLKAARAAKDERLCEPVLLGMRSKIEEIAAKNDIDLADLTILEPHLHPQFEQHVDRYFSEHAREGIARSDAERELRRPHYFANMLLAVGEVDGLIGGVDRHYGAVVKPILSMIGLKPGATTAAGLYILSIKDRMFFMADTAINIHMTSEKLAAIAVMAAEFAESMNISPRVAMLSYSNFGSVQHPSAAIVRDAVLKARALAPQLAIDGEMQADTAVVSEILTEHYPFSALEGAANVLIFPDMQSGNIAFKLLQRLGGARVIGPIILGLNAPAYVLQRHASVDEILNMVTVAVAQASLRAKRIPTMQRIEGGVRSGTSSTAIAM